MAKISAASYVNPCSLGLIAKTNWYFAVCAKFHFSIFKRKFIICYIYFIYYYMYLFCFL